MNGVRLARTNALFCSKVTHMWIVILQCQTLTVDLYNTCEYIKHHSINSWYPEWLRSLRESLLGQVCDHNDAATGLTEVINRFCFSAGVTTNQIIFIQRLDQNINFCLHQNPFYEVIASNVGTFFQRYFVRYHKTRKSDATQRISWAIHRIMSKICLEFKQRNVILHCEFISLDFPTNFAVSKGFMYKSSFDKVNTKQKQRADFIINTCSYY